MRADQHDRRTAYRVGFTETLNMEAETPEQAIGQMSASYERYREKEAHKRGRKLRKPLFAYSLSWAPDETPTKEEMLDAAHSSLKALKLEGLQTLIVQHLDEPQPHIHVLVNRIERDGSRPRRVSFDKITLSQWAEQYEREHGGIRCEQRVRNNALRRDGVPVKDLISLNRRQYEAQERAEAARQQRQREDEDRYRNLVQEKRRAALIDRQRGEIVALNNAGVKRLDEQRADAEVKLRPTWQRLHDRQNAVRQDLAMRRAHGPLHRAIFIHQHKELLQHAGPLRKRDVLMMIVSGKALTKRVQQAQAVEQDRLKDENRRSVEAALRIVREDHTLEFHRVRQRHQLEADVLEHTIRSENENVTRYRAAEDLTLGRIAPAEQIAAPANAAPPALGEATDLSIAEAGNLLSEPTRAKDAFQKAADPAPAAGPEKESDRIRREMAAWRKRNPGRDFGLEL